MCFVVVVARLFCVAVSVVVVVVLVHHASRSRVVSRPLRESECVRVCVFAFCILRGRRCRRRRRRVRLRTSQNWSYYLVASTRVSHENVNHKQNCSHTQCVCLWPHNTLVAVTPKILTTHTLIHWKNYSVCRICNNNLKD